MTTFYESVGLSASELQAQAQDFLKRSATYYSGIQQRLDEDLSMYSDNFWTDKLLKDFGRAGRIHETWNLWKVLVNAGASPFSQSPYHIEICDRSAPDAKVAQEFVDQFEANSDAKSSILEWVLNGFVLGQSIMVVSFEEPDDPDSVVPKISLEVVDDISQVAMDPSVKRSDMSDAEEGAVVSYISLTQARRLYGEDVVGSSYPDSVPAMCDIGAQWAVKPDMVQVVSYYFKTKDGHVAFVKFCGNHVSDPVVLPISVIPIIRTTGYKIRTADRKTDYIGIVRATFSLQLGANIGYSTLLERLNRAPKQNYLTHVSAMEGLEEYYRRLNDPNIPVTLWAGSIEPKPVSEAFETTDLRSTIEQSATLMSQTLGIPLTGINGINFTEKTATEVLTQQSNAISNVSCFYIAASKAIRVLGKIILELFGIGDAPFKLLQGPEVITRNMKRRQEIMMLSNMVPEGLKTVLAKYYADTISDDFGAQISADILANLPAEITLTGESDMDPNAVHVMKGMQANLDATMAQLQQSIQANAELTKELEDLKLQVINQKAQQELDWRKFMVSESNKVALEEAKLKLQGGKLDVEAQAAADKAMIDGARVAAEADAKAAEVAMDQAKLDQDYAEFLTNLNHRKEYGEI